MPGAIANSLPWVGKGHNGETQQPVSRSDR
jgi:hypothetical protein